MELNIDEALRYLGAQGADDGLRAGASALAAELQQRITPRFIWRAFPIGANSAFRVPESALAQSLLGGCTHAAVLVCTLGAAFDLWMKQLSARNMARAVMLDALGSAYVEAGCDAAEEAIRARFPGMHLTDRFSPGYGDLPLSLQMELTALAEANRIGVTVTPALLLAPQKSVTAIVGVAETPQPARIRGCACCPMNKSCPYRKAGTTCHV